MVAKITTLVSQTQLCRQTMVYIEFIQFIRLGDLSLQQKYQWFLFRQTLAVVLLTSKNISAAVKSAVKVQVLPDLEGNNLHMQEAHKSLE